MNSPRWSPWIVGSTTKTPAIRSGLTDVRHRVTSCSCSLTRCRPGSGRRPSGATLADGCVDREMTASLPIRLSSRRRMSMMRLSSITTECSISLFDTSHPLPIARVRTDEAVDDARSGADRRRTADRRVHDLGAGRDHDPAVDDRAVVDRAVDPVLDLLEQQPVRLEQRGQLPGVDPPTAQQLAPDQVLFVDQPLDRVGDLQLAAIRRLDRARPLRGWSRRTGTRRPARGRTVDRSASRRGARRGRRRRAWRCRTVADPARASAGSGPTVASTTRRAAAERRHERRQVLLEQVVAEVHHELVVAEERAGDQHAVGEAERCVLGDVRDRRAERAAVAERGHHLVARCRRRSPRCR